MKENQITIFDGASLKYFYLGTIGIVLSVVLMLMDELIILGIIGLPFAILLLLSIKGTTINFENRQVKPFLYFVFFKIGQWESLENYTRILLETNNGSTTYSTHANSTTITVKSYTITLNNKKNDRVEIKEFTDYKKAKSLLATLSEKLNLPSHDAKAIYYQKTVSKMHTQKARRRR